MIDFLCEIKILLLNMKNLFKNPIFLMNFVQSSRFFIQNLLNSWFFQDFRFFGNLVYNIKPNLSFIS